MTKRDLLKRSLAAIGVGVMPVAPQSAVRMKRVFVPIVPDWPPVITGFDPSFWPDREVMTLWIKNMDESMSLHQIPSHLFNGRADA